MGYYEDIGRAAGENARAEIEREGITGASARRDVHNRHLGGALAKAAVATVLTPVAATALLGWGVLELAKKALK